MLAALQRARTLFPFPILGIDTDNGGEFINETLIAYCEQAHLTFTWGRPYLLFHQLEQLQQAVFRCAVNCSPFVPSIPPAPLRVFSVERCIAGDVLAERSVPDPAVGLYTLYREQERRKRVLGWRRTHKDPFDGEWEQILSWVVANPERSSGDIFRELQRRSPGRYQPLQIRTHKPWHAENTSLPAGNR